MKYRSGAAALTGARNAFSTAHGSSPVDGGIAARTSLTKLRSSLLCARRGAACACIALAAPAILRAQAISRAQAVEAALARGPRLGIALADTLAARAQLLTARAFPNPTITTEYTKDAPQYHVFAEIPFDFGSIRSARVHSADYARQAALLRYRYTRAALAYDADTTYTRALAAAAHSQLSRRNAIDADSLRRIAEVRRDAGDASELDVQLAVVNAGQQANVAVADSLTLVTALLDLQLVTGMAAAAVTVTLADSLAPPPNDGAAGDGTLPLLVAAAEASVQSAEFGSRVQRRSIWMWPSVQAGFESGDPSGDAKGLLPVLGLSFPLPLLNRNRGPILSADAERARARAELAVARLESQALIARSLREREVAAGKVERDRVLLESANRVVAMSIRAYQEGAAPLANVLEAQRTAREVLGQYIDDVAASWIATSTVRLYTLTTNSRP